MLGFRAGLMRWRTGSGTSRRSLSLKSIPSLEKEKRSAANRNDSEIAKSLVGLGFEAPSNHASV